MSCDQCRESAASSALFCENCGSELAAPTPELPGASSPPDEGGVRPCPCGGAFAADGYCDQCGSQKPRVRDHMVEQPLPWLASVSDRGLRHHRNEDAAAIAVSSPAEHAILVVSDGVSSSKDPDQASLAAVAAARDLLVKGLTGCAELSDEQATELLSQATDAASAAARACSPQESDNPPSCTFVAAIAAGSGRFYVACVGDSRAYWVPDSGAARQLTVDDSLAEEMISAGVPREEAESGPHGHTITRWLGRDAPDHTPRLSAGTAPGPGWLLVCSDGLWNYCSEAGQLAAVFRQLTTEKTDPLVISEALVAWANDQGGRDNITVALARVTPSSSEVNIPREGL